MKKQGHNNNNINNIAKKNQSKFPNAKANNQNIVKIPLNISYMEIGKYDINGTTHIFMQKTNQNLAVTEGYHFVFHGNEQPTIYHTGDGHKYVQIDEELQVLIDKVMEHYKISDSKKIKSLELADLSKFFRYLLFIRMFNQRQQRIIADIYDKGKEILSELPNVGEQLLQDHIDKQKANIFKKQLQLADAQTSADDYLNDEYLTQLFIVIAQVNEINKKAQVVKKQNNKKNNQTTKMLRNNAKQQIKQVRNQLIGQLFPKDNSTLPTRQYNTLQNYIQFQNIFNQANKLLSINISREKLVDNTRPLSAILNLYGKNKKAICSFSIQQKHKDTYTITLTFGKMQYTQILNAKSIDEKVVKIDNTQQTLTNITNLFYNKLSSYFGVDIPPQQKQIPSVFNVKDIEFINEHKNFPKHQQGYVDKYNKYQLIYEAHPKGCICEKHLFTTIKDPNKPQCNTTQDPVLYYGGNDDNDDRNNKEQTFNNYCNKINGFKKLKNPVSVFSSIFWNKREPTIHNACAYGNKTTSDTWRQQYPNWQNRITGKTEQNKIESISEEEENKNSDQETQHDDNVYNNDVNINQDENIGNNSCWDSLCCLSKKTHKDDTKTVIMENNYDNINESELSVLDDIPLEIGKSMFAFAKKEKTKQKFNLLSCCMESNKDEKENEINIIDPTIYEEMPINSNNANINIGNNNIINKK